MKIITYSYNSYSFAIESDMDLVSDILSQVCPTAVVHKNNADSTGHAG